MINNKNLPAINLLEEPPLLLKRNIWGETRFIHGPLVSMVTN